MNNNAIIIYNKCIVCIPRKKSSRIDFVLLNQRKYNGFTQ